jgi:hypothetical protein
MSLIDTPHLEDHDGFYADLLSVHKGLDDSESQRLNARLIMILANHIGDRAVLKEALQLAEKSG